MTHSVDGAPRSSAGHSLAPSSPRRAWLGSPHAVRPAGLLHAHAGRGGAALAYQVVGDGELDLVVLLGWPSHLALVWENPAFAEFLSRLASFSRLILFDRVGNGMSDRGPTGQAFEDPMDDISAVLSAVGSERAAFFGCHSGAGWRCCTRPHIRSGRRPWSRSPPTRPACATTTTPGRTPEERNSLVDVLRTMSLDVDTILSVVAPSEAADPSTRRWFAAFFLSAAGPAENIGEIMAMGPVDVRGLLGSVHVPTLVLHRTGDRMASVEAGRYMAGRLLRATFRELPGEDHFPFFGDQDAVLALTQEFLTGRVPVAESDRVVLTVLFTDLVDSTARAAELGDRRWRRLREEHDAVVRSHLARSRGREVETTGDGFLATFEGPARAIRAATAIRTDLADLGLRLRAGLHTGECELVDGHVRGIAVHIAARVLALAAPDEVVCSRTVKDLVAGAGFRSTDRGTHRLRGVPDEWPLHAVDLTAP